MTQEIISKHIKSLLKGRLFLIQLLNKRIRHVIPYLLNRIVLPNPLIKRNLHSKCRTDGVDNDKHGY